MLVIHAPQKLDLTKPLQTKEGKRVTLFQTDGRGKTPLGGYIGDGATRYYWTTSGEHSDFTKSLENVPEKPLEQEYWYNYYQHENGDIDSSGPWDSHAKSVKDVIDHTPFTLKFICRKRVLVVEGQYDE